LERWLPLAGACTLALAAALTQAPKDRSQNGIAREGRHELVTLPYYRVFDNLAFRVGEKRGQVSNSLVQVTRPTLKSDAERAVKQIEGVSAWTTR
jgi:hypothetical protein